ncbi:MAG: DNA polymerase III subunit delta [Alphaproteobacteria bacterium]|nr:DNA polymerase III subunit delta [Alphaproteobacteria bacterium]
MKPAPREIERLLRAPPATLGGALVFGPDQGLVRERADLLARAVAGDLGDAFRVAQLTPAGVRDDPARLSDETRALAFGGGRRLVWVRGPGEAPIDAVEHALGGTGPGSFLLIEAGDLAARAPLRRLFEAAAAAVAIACYPEEGESLERVMQGILAEHGARATPETLAFLGQRLGGDRQLVRREIEKLILYAAGGGAAIGLADAEAVTGDVTELTLDDIAAAVAGGEHAALSRLLDKAFQQGESAIGVLRAVMRHLHRLLEATAQRERGATPEAAMAALRPPVFFRQQPAFRAALRTWSSAKLLVVLELVLKAEIVCKTSGIPAAAVCGYTLTRIAHAARRS